MVERLEISQWSSLCASLATDHKNMQLGISLMAQWLTLLPSNAGGPGSIFDQGTRFHMPQLRRGAAK